MRRIWPAERHLIWLRSLRSRLSACIDDVEREALWRLCTPQTRALLENQWPLLARDDQLPPAFAGDGSIWTIWLVLGGRGAGKTRTGAEWVRGMALGAPWLTRAPVGKFALIGETFADVRDVMIDGPSGLLAIHPRGERPIWTATRRRLEWPNGAVALAFSADDPESLRGPQFEAAWADELGKWRYADAAWDQLQFGLRLGARPREVVTTTPRAIPLLRRLLADPSIALSRASTQDNAGNLAPAFLDAVVGRYAGTRLGRQELDGELIEERADALWTRDLIETARGVDHPPLARIVVAVDPPASSRAGADACGIVAVGLDGAGVCHVLADESASGLKPHAWAGRAARLYRRLEADALVVEVNQGGEMVGAVLNEVDPGCAVISVRATRGKRMRAEPVSLLYVRGRVRHVGAFPALEDEMCDFGLDGLSGGRSPDRLDALVWAITHLALDRKADPRLRAL
ncbi:MAG: ATP-binding protein [Salinarimonadaceae bacterium]|nr:MAG: ATP-binding protein [Salinarimonadaceae bacterium]